MSGSWNSVSFDQKLTTIIKLITSTKQIITARVRIIIQAYMQLHMLIKSSSLFVQVFQSISDFSAFSFF